jgi:RimJ/RimL family protein N-acetyltransferase
LTDLSAWEPSRVPGGEVLDGATVRLEPINPVAHGTELWHAQQGDPALWTYMPVGPFEHEQALIEWARWAEDAPDFAFYAIVDIASSRALGSASYLRWEPEHGSIEIGFIWFGPELQRTRGATEAIYLLSRHAFDDLGYRRLEWKCNAVNERSRRAAVRFGFEFEGVFRQHMIVKGGNRDTAWYAIVDGDWPRVRTAYERWLADENFGADGRQVRTLTEIRDGL